MFPDVMLSLCLNWTSSINQAVKGGKRPFLLILKATFPLPPPLILILLLLLFLLPSPPPPLLKESLVQGQMRKIHIGSLNWSSSPPLQVRKKMHPEVYAFLSPSSPAEWTHGPGTSPSPSGVSTAPWPGLTLKVVLKIFKRLKERYVKRTYY